MWRGEWIFQVCTMEEAIENIWISMLNPFNPDKHIKEVLNLLNIQKIRRYFTWIGEFEFNVKSYFPWKLRKISYIFVQWYSQLNANI